MREAKVTLAGRRVLVTGGAGFIGTHVVRALQDLQVEVLVADRQKYPDHRVESMQVELQDPAAIEQVVRPGTDAIVHLAAATSVLQSVERPAQTVADNVTVTAGLLEQARQTGVGSFVLASTNAVVGSAEQLPFSESSALHPLTPYGATKAAAEMLLSAYTSSYALAGVALRLTNVYGPGMSGKDSIVPRLMRAARGGTTFDVYGDGQQIRDYVYVDDVVSAIVLSLRLNLTGTVVIGSGRSASVLQLVEFVQQVTGCHLPVRQVAAKAGEMREVSVETRRARSFGWLPMVDLREGLARVWQDWDVDAESIAFDERVA